MHLMPDRAVDINTLSDTFGSALQVTIGHDCLGTVKLLLDQGGGCLTTQRVLQFHSGCAVALDQLQIAMQKGHINIMQLLIRKGADVNSQRRVLHNFD